MTQQKNQFDSILTTTHNAILVSLNTDGVYTDAPGGYNDLVSKMAIKGAVGSFAGFLANNNIVSELGTIGKRNLGEIVEIKKADHTFYGMVCYDLNDPQRTKTPDALKRCLDEISKKVNGPVAYKLGKELLPQGEKDFAAIIDVVHSVNMKGIIYP